MPPDDDPPRLLLVVRRGGVDDLSSAAALAGAASVGCVSAFAAADPGFALWWARPGKVCLRARTQAQWDEVLAAAPHVLAGNAVAAFPPRRRAEREPVFDRLQAMATALEPPPEDPGPAPPGTINYLLNPGAPMSSGKVLAQVGHAAIAAARQLPAWAAAGCPGRLVAPDEAAFAEAMRSPRCVARVEDAGLTEVPPGTVTVLALA